MIMGVLHKHGIGMRPDPLSSCEGRLRQTMLAHALCTCVCVCVYVYVGGCVCVRENNDVNSHG